MSPAWRAPVTTPAPAATLMARGCASGRVRAPPRGVRTRGGRCLAARRWRPAARRASPRRRTSGSPRPERRRRRYLRKRRREHRPVPARDGLLITLEQHNGQRSLGRVACRAQSRGGRRRTRFSSPETKETPRSCHNPQLLPPLIDVRSASHVVSSAPGAANVAAKEGSANAETAT